jgi:hypothetical protein
MASRWQTPLAAAILVMLLLALVVSGQWPELRSKLASSANGLITIAPKDVRSVAIRSGSDTISFHRQPAGWTIGGVDAATPADLAVHLETALKFLNVAEPTRRIPAGELTADSFAAFGLDPPSHVAVIETSSGAAKSVQFGTSNPAGTSHYVRLGGAPMVYLMARHVAEEWRLVFGMAQRLRDKAKAAVASRGTDLLLPVSIAQVWAIEIVSGGKLTRFERDGAGAWFKHVGQHTHAAVNGVHVADSAQAPIIDAAFRALDAVVAEARVGSADTRHLAQYGLALPTMIVLFYARDSSSPLARLEFGVLADRLDRYARLAPDGAVVTVAEFEPRRLTELLKAVGAGS